MFHPAVVAGAGMGLYISDSLTSGNIQKGEIK